MRRVNLRIPRSWEELSGEQLLFVSSLFLQGLDRSVFLVKAFICFSGLKVLPGCEDGDNPVYRFKCREGKVISLTLGELFDFSRECEFLLGARDGFRPLPEIGGRKAREVMMYDACFGEFVSAMVYYNQFRDAERDGVFLGKLCAVMYPRGEWSGDIAGADDFAGLSSEVCYTAFLWFGAVMDAVVRECPDLFRDGDDEGREVSLRENVHGMYNLVTGNDITKEKEIAGMEMWRVLYDMDGKAKRIKELNEEMERHGRF